ncbi:MAG: hypothetical protein H8D67_09260 [Deltaproteobacteria bacterium]|nr:hypothetical protein [Deltaproteobacteria bacterium]
MSASFIIIIIACLILLPAAYLLFKYAGAKRNQTGGGEKEKEKEEWNIDKKLRRLIDSTTELRTLYAKLGYSPEVDRKAEQLVNEMKALIHAEIPDFAAFQSALREAEEQLEKKEREADLPAPLSQVRYQQTNEELLKTILAAGNNQEKVLELLNRDAVYEQLPFVEQIPTYKDGEVIWRTPVEHSIIRKRPTDLDRFGQLLDETENLVRTAGIRRDEQVGKEVLEVIARLKRNLERENAYFPTALTLLERKLSEWLHDSHNTAAQERKEQLDNLLREMVSVRHAYGLDNTLRKTLKESEVTNFKEMAQKHTKTYLETPWMQTPWLTNYILTNLIDSELAPLQKQAQRKPTSPVGVLQLIRDEIASGRYDSDENIRRLRQQEKKGLYVHSLLYPLLRLNRTPSAMTTPENHDSNSNR